MPRFFVRPEQIQEHQIVIEEDAHHIKDVLRMQIGESLTVCDGNGVDYEAQIDRFEKVTVICRILEQNPSISEPDTHITLFQGLPKSDKMEWILQKGTEVGISTFVPVAMQRSIVKYDAKKDAKKTERFQKITESAAKQSGRGQIPEVKTTVRFDEVIQEVKNFDLFLVPYENGQEHPLKSVLAEQKMPKTIAILIGPEGGIDPLEVETLQQEGARIVGLGPRILRTETAGLVAATAVLYHFDEM